MGKGGKGLRGRGGEGGRGREECEGEGKGREERKEGRAPKRSVPTSKNSQLQPCHSKSLTLIE